MRPKEKKVVTISHVNLETLNRLGLKPLENVLLVAKKRKEKKKVEAVDIPLQFSANAAA